jgi:hypothetical protein
VIHAVVSSGKPKTLLPQILRYETQYYLDINLSINDCYNSTVNPNDIILLAGLVHRVSMGRRVPLTD